MILRRINKRRRGFTLIEMVLYSAILAVIFVVVVNTLLMITRSYRNLKVSMDINESAALLMERLTREIREAESINTGSSALGSHPGRLVLNSFDQNENTESVDFFIESNKVKLRLDGLLVGSLVKDNVDVTNLIFRRISASSSEAVRISTTLEGTLGNLTKSENFSSTVVLRRSI